MRADIVISVGDDLQFIACTEDEHCPRTCDMFVNALPFTARLIQARWSGEAAWVPLRGSALDGAVTWFENPTSHPAPGQLLLYPGGLSEPELLVPYGPTTFASKVGQLAGSHFLTIIRGQEQLSALGRRVLWEGAQEIRMSRALDHAR
ncbi:MAG TPA: DUF3830 family protein [Gemmatimonadaceae bacterium]|jgi:hypothetical protein